MRKLLSIFGILVSVFVLFGCGASEESKQLQGRLINSCSFLNGNPKFCACMAEKIVSTMSSREISDYLRNANTIYAEQAHKKLKWDNQEWINTCRYEVYNKK